MKKYIFTTMLMLLAILVFSSCNDNSDRLTVLYNITLSDDMAQIADLAVTYKGDNGITVTDTIRSKTVWNKTVHMDTFPCQFGLVDYTFIPKPDSQLKKDSYDLDVRFSMFTREAKFSLFYNFVNPFNLKRDKVASFLDLANDHGDQTILPTVTKADKGFIFSGKNKPDTNLLMDDPYELSHQSTEEDSVHNTTRIEE